MVQAGGLDVGLVGFGVLAGVIDDGQLVVGFGHFLPASGQFGDDVGEVGDVRLVARIGVAADRDRPVDRHHQAEADEAKIGVLFRGPF